MVGDRGADHDTSGWDVARVFSFSESDEVEDDIEGVEREPFSSATKSGHDLIEDEVDAVAIRDVSDPGELSEWGISIPAVPADWLEEGRCDRVGSLGLDDTFEVVEVALGFLSWRTCLKLAAAEVWPEHQVCPLAYSLGIRRQSLVAAITAPVSPR